MKYPELLLVTLIFILVKNGGTEFLDVETMETSKTAIFASNPSNGRMSSGILKSHKRGSYPTPFNKSLTLVAPIGYGIIASIRMVDLRPNKADQLTLVAVNNERQKLVYINTWSFSHNKTYDSWETKTFDAPLGQIQVRFEASASGSYSWGYDGFQLTYTAYKPSRYCDIAQFNCLNGRCISNTLKCDGHNHCGDRREQLSCSPTSKKNVPAIAGGVVFLVIAVACVIFIVIRRSTRSRTEVQTIISHPPTSYPPSYRQQPGTYYPPPPPAYTAYSPGNVNTAYQ